ncbi:hypothetical protein [Collimonas antrihumi]|uniref:hypothetical protein n=1 Tax=Collimonas antrihumi TaxID=1940615 RepID=UPI001B8D2D35|nr:hypothetical protein [Collimonas antrihumi]
MKTNTALPAIPTRVFETPADVAARHLRVNGYMANGLHTMFQERRSCREQHMFYAYIGLGELIACHISCLGGMAGEW